MWVKLFKRSIIEFYKLRFDTRYNYQEDQEFCFRYFCCIKTIVCIKNIGYYYSYISDWESKYPRKSNMFYLYQSYYKSTMTIYDKKFNTIIAYFLDCWIKLIFNIYVKKDPLRRKFLLEFRKSVGENIMKSHLFFPTKWFIYIDGTGYISNLILKLHIKFKNISQ